MATAADTITETKEYKGLKVEIVLNPPYTEIRFDGWQIFLSSTLTAKFDADGRFIELMDKDGNYAGIIGITSLFNFMQKGGDEKAKSNAVS